MLVLVGSSSPRLTDGSGGDGGRVAGSVVVGAVLVAIFGLVVIALIVGGLLLLLCKNDVFFASFMAFQANVKISVYDETSLSCVHFAKAT